MLFNSIDFLIFFPVVTILFFLLPHKVRWFLLLASSCIFYMAFIPKYILILAVTIIVDYFVGLQLVKMEGKKKKVFLVVSIVCNVGFLFVFKYFNFFNTNLARLADFLHWNYPIENLKIILPIGLSFHTFQSMSYIIEVYRGNQKPERNFGIYALFVMFYPQLVAGPIERPQNLLHRFHEKQTFDRARVTDGLRLMLWGMFKKVVIADNLALFVNLVYNNPTKFHGASLILATYFFAFQIYCDFSGYTDIARGSARVMGFELMRNFNRPYFSKSISEFWKRWHISLSSWFRDYVYIPLGGNRKGKWKWYRNLMIVFLLSGLWHGANWTYIIWGGLNGVYLVAAIWFSGLKEKVYEILHLQDKVKIKNFIKVIITFNLVSLTWVFFRATSVTDAVYILKNMFVKVFSFPKLDLGVSVFDILLGILLIAVLLMIQLVQRRTRIGIALSEKPVWVRWSVYYIAITVILLLGVSKASDFIYFQF
ncbi:MAG: MBOAT family protein [Clostridia bacterium]|nr:MBOAT family protein [Clostridia bacterium]